MSGGQEDSGRKGAVVWRLGTDSRDRGGDRSAGCSIGVARRKALGEVGSRGREACRREGAIVGRLGADSRGRVERWVLGEAVSERQEDSGREGAVVGRVGTNSRGTVGHVCLLVRGRRRVGVRARLSVEPVGRPVGSSIGVVSDWKLVGCCMGAEIGARESDILGKSDIADEGSTVVEQDIGGVGTVVGRTGIAGGGGLAEGAKVVSRRAIGVWDFWRLEGMKVSIVRGGGGLKRRGLLLCPRLLLSL